MSDVDVLDNQLSSRSFILRKSVALIWIRIHREGTLIGIEGQYLLFDTGVIIFVNIRLISLAVSVGPCRRLNF